VGGRIRERESVCVCVRERVCVCLCVCVRESAIQRSSSMLQQCVAAVCCSSMLQQCDKCHTKKRCNAAKDTVSG